MRNLDLDALVMFKAVAEEGTVTRAAARLHRVQSNATTHIEEVLVCSDLLSYGY